MRHPTYEDSQDPVLIGDIVLVSGNNYQVIGVNITDRYGYIVHCRSLTRPSLVVAYNSKLLKKVL